MRAAQDGANVVIAAKTAVAHPKLPGTIYTAAEEGTVEVMSCVLTEDMYLVCRVPGTFFFIILSEADIGRRGLSNVERDG